MKNLPRFPLGFLRIPKESPKESPKETLGIRRVHPHTRGFFGFPWFRPKRLPTEEAETCGWLTSLGRVQGSGGAPVLGKTGAKKKTICTRWTPTWRKWLGSPPFTSHEVRPFGRETTLLSGLRITMIIHHLQVL